MQKAKKKQNKTKKNKHASIYLDGFPTSVPEGYFTNRPEH